MRLNFPTNTKPNAAKGNRLASSALRLPYVRLADVVAAALIVSTDCAVPLPGVIAAGANEQLKLLGKFAQANVICESNDPAFGDAAIVIVPDCPAARVNAAGAAPNDTLVLPPPPPLEVPQAAVYFTAADI